MPILGACGDGRGLYTISEYIPGANMHGFLHNGGLSGEKDSTVTIVRIALQIAQAMAHLHAHGITHRSLAPKNVLLDNTLTARVRDYGFASVKDDVWTTQRAANPRFPLYPSPILLLDEYFFDVVHIRFSIYCTRVDERISIYHAGKFACFLSFTFQESNILSRLMCTVLV